MNAVYPLPEKVGLQPDRMEISQGKYNGIGEDFTPTDSLALNNLRRTESSEALNLTLHQCARDGDVENMRRLLSRLTGNIKKKINKHDEEDLSALHYAARSNHFLIVQLLLEEGADVNNKAEEDATPLHYAARYRRETRTRRKTDNDDTNNMDSLGIVGDLIESNDQRSVLLYLVSKGAQINAEDKYGLTPLHFAAMRGNEVAAKELLSCSDINSKATDLQSMTALHLAAIHNNKGVAQMLIDTESLQMKDGDECTALHHACAEGNCAIVNMLFQAGAQLSDLVSKMVTDTDVDGSTCLHLAVDSGHHEVTKTCLDKGADVNGHRTNHTYPLHLAAVAGDLSIVQLLLQRGARVDALNQSMETPLHKAAAYNHTTVVEHLIANGAKVNRKEKDNYTPLLLACVKGNAETIDILLKMKADITMMDKSDKTAIYLATEENKLTALKRLLVHKGAIDLLKWSDRYDNQPLHVAAIYGYVSILKCLLENGADIDCKNEEEHTPLHLAAKFGRINIVLELVKRNKLVCMDEDDDSNTPLHIAAIHGQRKVAQALLDAGANVEARNFSSWTPLDCASASGMANTARILLEADSPVDPMDKTKTTPLHLACANGHVDCVNLLLEWQANVSQCDSEGKNCLDQAIDNNQEDVAMVIVSSERWEEALRNETLDLTTGSRNTPMRKLIKKIPWVAEKVFHRCTTANDQPGEHPDYEVNFNYEFLDDTYANWREDTDALSSAGSIYGEDEMLLATARPYSKDSATLKKNHPLYIMVNAEREDLLAHPLVTTLLRHKWNSFGRWVYYINFTIYAIFLAFLTGYILVSNAPFELDNKNLTSCAAVEGAGYKQHLFATIGKYFIYILSAWNLLREVSFTLFSDQLLQVYQAKLNYIGVENCIEWVTYVTAILLVIDFTDCQGITGYRLDWQWILGAISIFLAWIDLVLFIRKVPRFGIYVVMFTDILYTFTQFAVVFILFIIAFALAFYTLLRNQISFKTVEVSFVSTFAMMIGEFNYESIFHSSDLVFSRWLTYIIFLIFMVLMSIIIMNLLVGLAVDDIKAVQDKAILKRLAMQVQLALDVESILPQFIRRKFVVRSQIIKPNQDSKNCIRQIFSSDNSVSSTSIAAALNPELEDIEVVQETQEKMQEDIARLSKRLYAQNARLESMLTAILNKEGIEWQDEDLNELGED